MGRAVDITVYERSEVLKALTEPNATIDSVAKRFHICRRTVQRIKKQGVAVRSGRIGKCGRKRLTTPAADRKLIRSAAQHPRRTLDQHVESARSCGIGISRMTLSRRLKERGFAYVKPCKKPQLTFAMRKKRLEWARQHAHWSVEDWRKVCFSDESTFECHHESKRVVLHQPGTPQPTTPSVKFPTKVMVWSMMSSYGTGRLHVVEGTMNAVKYIEVMKNRMIPQAREWFGADEWVYMQDGAPCHTAKRTIEFLSNENVTVLKWPGNSPDLNPIETLWAIVKERLKKHTLKTKQEVISELIKVWIKDVSVAVTCQRLIDTMPDRVQAVIKAKGGHTDY